jgi:hypothetical protein
MSRGAQRTTVHIAVPLTPIPVAPDIGLEATTQGETQGVPPRHEARPTANTIATAPGATRHTGLGHQITAQPTPDARNDRARLQKADSEHAVPRRNALAAPLENRTPRRAQSATPRRTPTGYRCRSGRRGPGPGRPPYPTNDPQDGGVESRTPRRAQSATPRRIAPNGQPRPP